MVGVGGSASFESFTQKPGFGEFRIQGFCGCPAHDKQLPHAVKAKPGCFENGFMCGLALVSRYCSNFCVLFSAEYMKRVIRVGLGCRFRVLGSD